MAAMDAKRWVLGSPYFSCIRRARDLRDDMLRFSFAWRPRLRFLNPPPPWPRQNRQACFLGSDRELALRRGARPINIEMSLSSLYRKRPTGCTSGISFYRLIRAPAPVHLHEYITQARGSFSSSCRSTHEQTLSFFCSPPSITLPPAKAKAVRIITNITSPRADAR